MFFSRPSLCKTTNNIRLMLLFFGHSSVEKSWRGTVLNPDFSRLYYIVDGNACIHYKSGSTLFLKKGSWYLLPAGASFDFECANSMEHIYFHLKLCGSDNIDLLRNFEAPYVYTPSEDELASFLNNFATSGIIGDLKIYHSVHSILLTMIEGSGIVINDRSLSPCIEKAIEYINSHLSLRLTVSQIAANSFISKSTLTKRFKKELEISVHDYICNSVLSQASQMLLKTDLSILTISEHFGFCDQFYFSKKFKEKFGITPRNYRKAPPV